MLLEDLVRRFELYGVCTRCGRMGLLDIASLIADGGASLEVEAVRRRVRCRRCGQRTHDIRIVYAGPCGVARGFHYRD